MRAHPAQLLLMSLNRFDEEGGICGPLITNFIVRDDLIFGFLNLDQSAEFRWLGGFPFPYDLCGRLKQTDEFLRRVQILSEQSRFRLTHHLSHERNHSFRSARKASNRNRSKRFFAFLTPCFTSSAIRLA